MEKKDLKTGMYVKLRDGSICIVQNEQNLLVDVKSGGYVELRYYNDDLTIMQNLLCFDVVVVYENFKKVNVLWERKELLTKEEKEYLKEILKGINCEVTSITKGNYYIEIRLEHNSITLPPYTLPPYKCMIFKFEGMKTCKPYTLKELGLED